MIEEEERLVVRSYSARAQRIGWLIRLACMVGVFFVGLLMGGKIFTSEMSLKRQLEQEAINLALERDNLKQRLMNAEIAVEVDRAALEEVRKTVVALQQQVAEGEEELGLYRKLMRDESLPDGLSIRELSLTGAVEGGVAYQLVLQNKTTALRAMEVMVAITIEGELSGETKAISLHEMDEELETSPISMKFKYFGVAQGVVNLPEGFEPRVVDVSVWKKGKTDKVDKLFDWRLEET